MLFGQNFKTKKLFVGEFKQNLLRGFQVKFCKKWHINQTLIMTMIKNTNKPLLTYVTLYKTTSNNWVISAKYNAGKWWVSDCASIFCFCFGLLFIQMMIISDQDNHKTLQWFGV